MKKLYEHPSGVYFQIDTTPDIDGTPVVNSIHVLDSQYRICGPDLRHFLDDHVIVLGTDGPVTLAEKVIAHMLEAST